MENTLFGLVCEMSSSDVKLKRALRNATTGEAGAKTLTRCHALVIELVDSYIGGASAAKVAKAA